MSLAKFTAEQQRAIFARLQAGLPPEAGTWDELKRKDGLVKGPPQMGVARFEPSEIILEFIYPDSQSSATVLTVRLPSSERIVFLPVPSWVVENIWQGDVDGSYHFESDAQILLGAFSMELEPERNLAWFGPRQAKRRE